MKYFPTFDEYLKEAKINELGEGVKPYKYKFDSRDLTLDDFGGSQLTATFTTSSKINYVVRLKNVMRFLDIDFSIGTGDVDSVPSKGDVFQIMSTIMHICKDVLEANPQIHGIRYEPNSKGGETLDKGDGGRQRDRLYRLFISKQFGKVDYTKQGATVFAKFA